MNKLLNIIERGEHLELIISWIKNLLVSINYSLKQITLQGIKDVLLYVSNSKNLINEDEMIDINIILSYINSRPNNKKGYSNLITSFANN